MSHDAVTRRTGKDGIASGVLGAGGGSRAPRACADGDLGGPR